MQHRFDNVTYVVGSEAIAAQMANCGGKEIFAVQVLDFLQSLSGQLMHDPQAKAYGDVVTFAFWCRRPSVQAMGQSYAADGARRGRGAVFHIAPANVAVNFAYSFVSGLLAGNANIVRLPSRKFSQVDIICAAIRKALEEGSSPLKDLVCMVQYGHDEAVTAYFSSLCDTRVIWGGNAAIEAIRRIPLAPRANEITFADRFSLALIDSDDYLNAKDKQGLARAFYNDTYLSDQNACTSPRLIVWLGERTSEAREIFWQELHMVAKEKYHYEPIQAVDKLTAAYSLAAQGICSRIITMPDNILLRAEVETLTESICACRNNSGFFLEYTAAQLDEIYPVCGSRCQTIAIYGDLHTAVAEFIESYNPRGIDRIVPIGKTLDFTLVWDGIDLIRTMSRRIQHG